jgi:hypothetical protein
MGGVRPNAKENRSPKAGDGQEPRQTFSVAQKIATIRPKFSVHSGNTGSTLFLNA